MWSSPLWTSLVAQTVKKPTIWKTWFRSLVGKILWRRKWQPTPVFLPEKSHGQRSLAGYRPWGHQRVGHARATEYARPLGDPRACQGHPVCVGPAVRPSVRCRPWGPLGGTHPLGRSPPGTPPILFRCGHGGAQSSALETLISDPSHLRVRSKRKALVPPHSAEGLAR